MNFFPEVLQFVTKWWSLETLVVVFLYVRVWRPWVLRRSVWGWTDSFEDRETGILVDIVKSDVTDRYIRPAVGLGVATSIGQISTSLAATRMRIFSRARHQSSNPFEIFVVGDSLSERVLKHGNNVILGGPKTNVLTADIVRHLAAKSGRQSITATMQSRSGRESQRLKLRSEPFVFDVSESTITVCDRSYTGSVTSGKQESGSGQVNLSDYNGVDFGFVIRHASLAGGRHSDLRMVVFFGSQTFGVVGATSWLVDSPTVGTKPRVIKSYLRKNPDVVCVVRVDIHHGAIRNCELLEIVTIPE